MTDTESIRWSLFLVVIITALYIINTYIDNTNKENLMKVKSGEYSLYCMISGKGYTYIEPDHVVSFHYEIKGGMWIFTNGYATNCKYQQHLLFNF